MNSNYGTANTVNMSLSNTNTASVYNPNNYTISTTNTGLSYGYGSIGDTITLSSPYSFPYAGTLYALLTDDEITAIVERAKVSLNELEFSGLCNDIVNARHCTEDFLLSIADSVSWNSLQHLHKSDLLSGKYPSLVIYYKMKDKK